MTRDDPIGTFNPMANQLLSEAAELVKALTGIETLSGVAVASYLFASVLTFLAAKAPQLKDYVDARPRLARVVEFLRVFAIAWRARGADDKKQ